MKPIRMGADEIPEMRRDIEAQLEVVYESFQTIEPCDGGVASNMIGLIASAAVEASQASADSYLALMVLCSETAQDFESTDTSAAQTLKGFNSRLEKL